MRVIRADAMGFCFGVRDALKLTDAVSHPELVTIHGELVHNQSVQNHLKNRGFLTTPEDQRQAVPATKTVLITA
ncbi:MAG: hypothetical protein KDA84_10220, partial [Planctomycetaceae bacterium]|nr:hypothetical protein [Planctomycetaceae bacterium]